MNAILAGNASFETLTPELEKFVEESDSPVKVDILLIERLAAKLDVSVDDVTAQIRSVAGVVIVEPPAATAEADLAPSGAAVPNTTVVESISLDDADDFDDSNDRMSSTPVHDSIVAAVTSDSLPMQDPTPILRVEYMRSLNGPITYEVKADVLLGDCSHESYLEREKVIASQRLFDKVYGFPVADSSVHNTMFASDLTTGVHAAPFLMDVDRDDIDSGDRTFIRTTIERLGPRDKTVIDGTRRYEQSNAFLHADEAALRQSGFALARERYTEDRILEHHAIIDKTSYDVITATALPDTLDKRHVMRVKMPVERGHELIQWAESNVSTYKAMTSVVEETLQNSIAWGTYDSVRKFRELSRGAGLSTTRTSEMASELATLSEFDPSLFNTLVLGTAGKRYFSLGFSLQNPDSMSISEALGCFVGIAILPKSSMSVSARENLRAGAAVFIQTFFGDVRAFTKIGNGHADRATGALVDHLVETMALVSRRVPSLATLLGDGSDNECWIDSGRTARYPVMTHNGHMREAESFVPDQIDFASHARLQHATQRIENVEAAFIDLISRNPIKWNTARYNSQAKDVQRILNLLTNQISNLNPVLVNLVLAMVNVQRADMFRMDAAAFPLRTALPDLVRKEMPLNGKTLVSLLAAPLDDLRVRVNGLQFHSRMESMAYELGDLVDVMHFVEHPGILTHQVYEGTKARLNFLLSHMKLTVFQKQIVEAMKVRNSVERTVDMPPLRLTTDRMNLLLDCHDLVNRWPYVFGWVEEHAILKDSSSGNNLIRIMNTHSFGRGVRRMRDVNITRFYSNFGKLSRMFALERGERQEYVFLKPSNIRFAITDLDFVPQEPVIHVGPAGVDADGRAGMWVFSRPITVYMSLNGQKTRYRTDGDGVDSGLCVEPDYLPFIGLGEALNSFNEPRVYARVPLNLVTATDGMFDSSTFADTFF